MARGRKNITETEIGNTGLSLKGVNGKVEEDISKLWRGKNKKDFLKEMISNDPYCSAWTNAKNAIALKPDWGVKPNKSEDKKS